MVAQLWYYEKSGTTEGPVSIDQLRQLVTDGMLSNDDRIKSETMSEWVSLSSLRDELDAIGGLATAVQDEFDDRHSDLNIDDFNLESGHDVLSGDVPDIDSFVVAGDTDSPRPEFVSSHKPKEEPEPTSEDEGAVEEFLVRSLGMTLGPLTYEEIIEMAQTGSLTKGDEIKVGESEWIAVESIAQIGTSVSDTGDTESSAGVGVESSAGTDSSSDSTSGKPRRKPKSRRTSSAGKSSPGRKKRRRKKKKKDEFLAEIFAEVFTDDGKVRHERTAAAAAPAAAAPDTVTAATEGTAPPSDANGMAGSGAGTPAGMAGGMAGAAGGMAGAAGGMNGMNGMGSSPGFASQQAARPAFKPPPKPKKKKSSGDGLSLPEPKVMGMIGGGVLAVAILIGGFMGYIPLPGFGIDPDTFFKEVAAAYPKAAAGDATAWRQFNQDYGKVARDLMIDLVEPSKTDPTAKRNYNAAKAVVKLAGQPHHFKEGQKEAFKEFQQILVGG